MTSLLPNGCVTRTSPQTGLAARAMEIAGYSGTVGVASRWACREGGTPGSGKGPLTNAGTQLVTGSCGRLENGPARLFIVACVGLRAKMKM